MDETVRLRFPPLWGTWPGRDISRRHGRDASASGGPNLEGIFGAPIRKNQTLRIPPRQRTIGRCTQSGQIGGGREPLQIDASGYAMTYCEGSAKIAFCLGVDQADKPRAFDGLKHNRVNLY